MSNEQTTSVVPTGLLYGMYGSLAMIVCSLLSAIFGTSMSFLVGIISIIATLAVIIYTMVMAIRHHRDTLQKGEISFSKAFTITLLIAFLIGIISGAFMYLYYAYIDNSSLAIMLEHGEELFEKVGISEKDMDIAMSEMRKKLTPFGMFQSSIITNLFLGIIVGIISSLVMKKEESNPFLRNGK